MAIVIDKIIKLLLAIAIIIALWRGTNMGIAYPTDETLLVDIDYAPKKVFVWAALALVAICIFTDWRHFVPRLVKVGWPYQVLIAGYAMSLASSIAASDSWFSAVGGTGTFLTYTLPCIAFSWKFGVEAFVRLLAWFCILSILLSAVYIVGFPEYALMTGVHEGAVRGLFTHKNDFGAFCAMSLPLFLSLGSGNSLRRVWWIFCAIIAACFVLASRSVGALVIMLGCVPVYFFGLFFLRIEGLRARFLVLSVLGLVCLASIAFSMTGGSELVLNALGRDATLTGRTDLWQVLFSVSLERPLLGFGPGTVQQPEFMHLFAGLFGWNANTTHNSFLELVIAIGYPASFWFFGLLAANACCLILSEPRRVSDLRAGSRSLAIIAGVCIAGISASGAFLTLSYSWGFLLTALLFQPNSAGGLLASSRGDYIAKEITL
jgi:O-antigen ligase